MYIVILNEQVSIPSDRVMDFYECLIVFLLNARNESQSPLIGSWISTLLAESVVRPGASCVSIPSDRVMDFYFRECPQRLLFDLEGLNPL